MARRWPSACSSSQSTACTSAARTAKKPRLPRCGSGRATVRPGGSGDRESCAAGALFHCAPRAHTHTPDARRDQGTRQPHRQPPAALSLTQSTEYGTVYTEEELRHLIDRSREIWIAANNPKQRTAPEEDVYRFARGSVVADRDLSQGHVITEADIWTRRPGSGEIAAYDFDKVVGKRLLRAVTRNTQLKWGDLGLSLIHISEPTRPY